MNNCIFSGRFTSDPETRFSQSGETAITRFRLAVNRRFKKEGEPDADFINFVAFNKNAENIGKYFTKGSMIIIESNCRTGSYEKDGRKVYTTDFVVDSWEFVGGRAETPEKPSEKPTVVSKAKDGEFVAVPDEELPWD